MKSFSIRMVPEFRERSLSHTFLSNSLLCSVSLDLSLRLSIKDLEDAANLATIGSPTHSQDHRPIADSPEMQHDTKSMTSTSKRRTGENVDCTVFLEFFHPDEKILRTRLDMHSKVRGRGGEALAGSVGGVKGDSEIPCSCTEMANVDADVMMAFRKSDSDSLAWYGTNDQVCLPLIFLCSPLASVCLISTSSASNHTYVLIHLGLILFSQRGF